MATAIGINLINHGKVVKFYKTPTLVNMLSEAKKENTLSNLVNKISRTDLLILDEWGYIPLDNQGAQLLFQIVAFFPRIICIFSLELTTHQEAKNTFFQVHLFMVSHNHEFQYSFYSLQF